MTGSVHRQNPETGAWEPAEPLPWMEEHGLFARVLFFLTGVQHCGKGKRQWGYHSQDKCKCCRYWAAGQWDGAMSVFHTCGRFGSKRGYARTEHPKDCHARCCDLGGYLM